MSQDFSTVETVADGGLLTIHLLDRRLIEQPHVQRVDSEIQRAISEHPAGADSGFIIDFARVEFISSAMLGVVITAHSMMRSKGADGRPAPLCVCNLTKDLQKMFKMMKLDTRIKVRKTLADARRDVGAS